jgi:membrane fusion protein (multidrug efflux system)
MTVVPLEGVWVDANFKENQLRKVRIGQPVSLEADVYGRKVRYHGTVEGLGAGTGSAFSLLPAQNATGNWIKIVQRVPVRIALRPDELSAHPLRVGLSMDVQVDVRDGSGKTLADTPRAHPVASTAVFDGLERDADARVRQIIASNGASGSNAAVDAHGVAEAAGPQIVASAR